MTPLAQNFAVLIVVGGCFLYVAWQAIQAFRGRKSKLGSCCAKGCSPVATDADSVPKAAPVQFLPLENLGRRPSK